ncbi:unnamed protein product [Ectocarpus sp. 12 AP-2014]
MSAPLLKQQNEARYTLIPVPQASSSLDRLSMDSSTPVSVLLEFRCQLLQTVPGNRNVLSANARMFALTQSSVRIDDMEICVTCPQGCARKFLANLPKTQY